MFSDHIKSIALYPALDRFLAGFFLMMTAIVIGYLTAVWAIDATRPEANDLYGPWKLQTLGGKSLETPYSEARLAREGPFVLPPDEIAVFVARTDTDGRALRGNCDYRISGKPLKSRWWTLTAYDMSDDVIELPGTPHTLSREMLVPASPDNLLGTDIIVEPLQTDLVVYVTDETRYDRWLPIRPDERFYLVLRVFGADTELLSGEEDETLPKIVLEECQ